MSRRRLPAALMWVLILLLDPAGLLAENSMPQLLRDVGIDQNLGGSVPLDLSFVDEQGGNVRLNEYFSDKPVLLTLVSYECEMLCAESLDRLLRTLRGIDLDLGTDYDVLSVTFDPDEGPELAAGQKQAYVQRYGRQGAGAGWHFLTGTAASIERLAQAVGFRYRYDARTDQYIHPAGIIVLTPQGTISRYLYGIDYPPRDVRLALVEASRSKVGTLADQVLLFCYQYDPAAGRYSLAIVNLVRLGGVVTVLAIGGFVVFSIRRERRRRGKAATGETPEE